MRILLVASLALASTLAAPSSWAQAPAADRLPEPSFAQALTPRVRGGLSLGGGYGFFHQGSGPVMDLSFRVGGRLNRYLSLQYQASGILTSFNRPRIGNNDYRAAWGGAVHNIALAGVTLWDRLEIHAGPSLDLLFAGECKGDGCDTGLFGGPGVHGRVAVALVRFAGAGGRPTGITLGVDSHASFVRGGVPGTFTGGLGWEWF